MNSYAYDASFEPPAAVVEMIIGSPGAVPDHPVRALLDSGAYQTVIPEDVVRSLGLVRLDEVDVFGVGRDPVRSRVYLVSARIPELPAANLRVLSWSRSFALVGRDLPNRLLITLDGPQQQLTIEGASP